MRLTDLLGAEVVDRCGQRAGRVHDVRFVRWDRVQAIESGRILISDSGRDLPQPVASA